MSQIITGTSRTKVLNGLDTYVHTTAATSMYVIEIDVAIQPNSGLSVVLKQNSTTIATSAAPSADQKHVVLRAVANCTAGDTLSAVLTSSTAIDQQSNAGIKAILNIHQGSNG